MRHITFLLAVLMIGVSVCVPSSSPAAVDGAKVNAAIQAGTKYLETSNGAGQGGYQGFGARLLAGLAMLEGGVKPDSPAILQILETTRTSWSQETNTYTISLMILFLERLGHAEDVPIVQLLGIRLFGGLTTDGGWTYTCPDLVPMIRLDQTNDLIATPDNNIGNPAPPPPKKDDGFPTIGGKTSPLLPAVGKNNLPKGIAAYFTLVRTAMLKSPRQPGGDNSNTQFGLIALWASARRGIPVDEGFQLLEARFLKMQSGVDYGWGYTPNEKSSAAMTCAGLLGLAVGAGRSNSGFAKIEEPGAKPESNDPFDMPKKDKPTFIPGPNNALVPITPAQRKARVEGALKSLGTVLKLTPNGRGLKEFAGHGDEYYTMWSVERVCMAFGLETLGDQKWYDWGSNYLLAQQDTNGSFRGGSHGTDVATSFAVLFLCRSNFVSDLTKRITGQVKDPGQSEMRATKDFQPPLSGAPKVAPSGPDPGTMPTPVTKKPEEIADHLVKATDFASALREARESKGSEYTAGMLLALPKLDGNKQIQVREALDARLKRMTSKTLRAMLVDQDQELRRAAAHASGFKEDRTLIPDLIERIVDASPEVVVAARDSLKSLTGKNLGPTNPDNEGERKKAQAEWNKWFLAEGKK